MFRVGALVTGGPRLPDRHTRVQSQEDPALELEDPVVLVFLDELQTLVERPVNKA